MFILLGFVCLVVGWFALTCTWLRIGLCVEAWLDVCFSVGVIGLIVYALMAG